MTAASVMLRLVDRGASPLVAGLQTSSEDLAKAWLVRLIERTPLRDVSELEFELLTTEAAPFIDGILRGVESGSADSGFQLPTEERERVRGFGRLRRGETAPAEIPRDLAALQAVLIESLRRDIPERRGGDFARSVERLAEIFGSIQAALTESLVRERAGAPRRDPLTGLPGRAELHEWLQLLLAEHRRYGHPFAMALVDVDGLGQINRAHGRGAGDRMLAAVGDVICSKIRTVDRPFRLRDDEFLVLMPHGDSARARPMAERVAHTVAESQGEDDPRVAVTIGISSCPSHGEDPDRLLQMAEEAAYSAKAAGLPVAVADDGHVAARD
jgi:diguanylate cyclase (GGDEF)-like protein